MLYSPIPAVPEFTIEVQEGWIRCSDLTKGRFDRILQKTQETRVDPGEPVILSVNEDVTRWLNEYVFRKLAGSRSESEYLYVLQFTPVDPLHENVVQFCVRELAAVRHARTSEPFEQSPKFNLPERSRQGRGMSPQPYGRHWEAALGLLADSRELHEALAERVFGLTVEKLQPRHYEKMLHHQIKRDSINGFWPRHNAGAA